MPITVPGPRLCKNTGFQHLGGKGIHKRAISSSLNITPMIDTFVVLVVFLLSTFSATGELIMSQKGVELPNALNDKELERAPIITITRDTVAFKGDAVADPKALVEDTSSEWKIPELFDRLQLEKFNFEKQDIPDALKAKLRGLVVLQADKSVDAKVLNRVMKTAYAAEYTDVMFAIMPKKRK